MNWTVRLVFWLEPWVFLILYYPVLCEHIIQLYFLKWDRKASIYLCPCKGKTTTNYQVQHLLISVWGHNLFLNHDVVKWKLKNKLVKINVIIMVNLVLMNSSAYIMVCFLWKTAFLWCKMKFRRYPDFLG